MNVCEINTNFAFDTTDKSLIGIQERLMTDFRAEQLVPANSQSLWRSVVFVAEIRVDAAATALLLLFCAVGGGGGCNLKGRSLVFGHMLSDLKRKVNEITGFASVRQIILKHFEATMAAAKG